MNALDELISRHGNLSGVEMCIYYASLKPSTKEIAAQAATELTELQNIKEAVWQLAEEPDSHAKLRDLLKLADVEI